MLACSCMLAWVRAGADFQGYGTAEHAPEYAAMMKAESQNGPNARKVMSKIDKSWSQSGQPFRTSLQCDGRMTGERQRSHGHVADGRQENDGRTRRETRERRENDSEAIVTLTMRPSITSKEPSFFHFPTAPLPPLASCVRVFARACVG